MTNPIVWKLQEPPTAGRDYSSAEQFGEIREVLTPYEHPSKQPDFCLMKMIDVLAEFEEGDYILFGGGDPLTPVFAGLVLARRGFTEFNWLKWDRVPNSGDGFYTPVHINLDAVDRMIKTLKINNGES